jgi:alpha-glucosidase
MQPGVMRLSLSVPAPLLSLLLLAAAAVAPGRAASVAPDPREVRIDSPDSRIQIRFRLGEAGGARGVPLYSIAFDRKTLIRDGRLGIALAGAPSLTAGFRLRKVVHESQDHVYRVFPGKTSTLHDRFRQVTLLLEESAPGKGEEAPGAAGRQLELIFRAYDDGVAFRYRFPRSGSRLEIAEEQTTFPIEGNPKAYALPLGSFTTSYEAYYTPMPLRQLPAKLLLGLPLLLEYPEGVWAAFTEADLTDYAGMYLAPDPGAPGTLVSRLSPLPSRPEVKVEIETPHASPWRVVMIAPDPGRLIESTLVLNLNPPCALPDTSWIHPGKTTFPWWNGYTVGDAGFEGGLNTRTIKHYIDFCAQAGIPYHSLDGFDTAWYGGPIVPYEGADITKSVPAIDLPEVLAYARLKGVRLRLWMHWQAAKAHMDRAFPLYEKWGIEGVMIDFMDRDDQEMVRFLRALVEKAAQHHLTVTLHGVSKPTGIQRTYPNLLTFEGVMNLEYDKWDPHGSTPQHEMLVPFVRMLAGPMDYHLGSFRSVPEAEFRPHNIAPVIIGTPARMLAMYVVYENPLPMVADYPAAYRNHPGLKFLAEVPTVWDETRVLSGRVGEYLAIARRRGREWYVGTLTNSSGRDLALPLRFLGKGKYVAETYADDLAGSSGALRLVTRQETLDAAQAFTARLAPAGGFAARLRPAEPR